MIYNKLPLIALFTAAALYLGAASLSQYLPDLSESQEKQLRGGDLLSNDSTKADSLSLLPRGTIMEKTVSSLAIDEKTLFTECLTLIPYPSYFERMSHAERQLHVFNTLRSISTQEGIFYISFRRGNKPALLIEDSYVTDRPGSRKKLDDPVAGKLPKEDKLIIFQKDTSFKKNYYEYRYVTSKDEIFQEVTNKTDMKVFGLIPAVRREVLNINTSILFTEEGMLAYSLAVAPNQQSIIRILTFEVHLPSAFQRRITAVQEWFQDQLAVNQFSF